MPMGDQIFYASSSGGARTPIEELLDLARNPGRPAWHAAASCRGVRTAIFFPERGESAAPAKAVCAGCEALEDCRAWALAQPHREIVGVWGGMSGRERRLYHGAAQPAPAPPKAVPACVNCHRPARAALGRCWACYAYHRRHGSDRPAA